MYNFIDGMGNTVSVPSFPMLFAIKLFGIPHLGTRFRQRILKNILASFHFEKNALALDIGCGYGFNSIALSQAGLQVFAIDTSTKRLAIAKNIAKTLKQKIIFKNTSVYRMSFPSNYFDICVFFEVIEHLQDPEKALLEIFRVLKPKGLLIMSYPLPANNYTLHKALGHLHSGFPDTVFARIIKNARFTQKTTISYAGGPLGKLAVNIYFSSAQFSVVLSALLSPFLDTLLQIDRKVSSQSNATDRIVILKKTY